MAFQNRLPVIPPGFETLFSKKVNPNTPHSTLNKQYFKLIMLFIYKLIVENNTDKLGNEIGKKRPISKRGVCIYMAQHNKTFRRFYLILKTPGKRADKHYPKSMEARKKLGLDFYKNVVTDKRKNKEIDTLYNAFKVANKGQKQFFIRVSEGGVNNRKFSKRKLKK